MKGYIQTCLLALAAVALGQTGLNALPDCAKSCAADLPKECSTVDFKCYCSSSSWIQSLSCCVKNSCADVDQSKTIQVAVDLCKLVGVAVPTVASCAGTSSAASSSGAAASSSSTTGSVTGAQTATTASRSSASSAQTSSSSAAAASATSATSATRSATSASSAAASAASATSSPGAAAGNFIGQGITAAGAAAFVFALL